MAHRQKLFQFQSCLQKYKLTFANMFTYNKSSRKRSMKMVTNRLLLKKFTKSTLFRQNKSHRDLSASIWSNLNKLPHLHRKSTTVLVWWYCTESSFRTLCSIFTRYLVSILSTQKISDWIFVTNIHSQIIFFTNQLNKTRELTLLTWTQYKWWASKFNTLKRD